MQEQIYLTPSAAERLKGLTADKSARLRIIVDGGGCYGFQYSFKLDDMQDENDHIFTSHGAEVIIDKMSLEIIQGSEIDYVDNMMGAAFVINNPNATASCGCGNSFSIL
jgi:iron-sulfur cluster insertion protein